MTSRPDFPAAPDTDELTPGVLPGGPVRTTDADPDVDDTALEPHAGAPTSLDQLRSELAAQVVADEITFAAPTRPGYSVRYRTDITDDDMKRFRRKARLKTRNPLTGEADIDELKVSKLLLGVYCTALLRDGVVVVDNVGDPMTFRSPELHSILGVSGVVDAVGKFYGTDGAVVSVGRALITAAGWVDDPEAVDAGPTRA